MFPEPGFILDVMHKKDVHRRRLEVELSERKPARTQSISRCIRCGYCCFQRTCVPTPHEIPTIAKFLKMSLNKFVEEYTVGDAMGDAKGKMHFFLRFINTEQRDIAGTFLPTIRTYDSGQCIFYSEEKQKCLIYPVRPLEARVFNCWDDSDVDDYNPIESWTRGTLHKIAPNMKLP